MRTGTLLLSRTSFFRYAHGQPDAGVHTIAVGSAICWIILQSVRSLDPVNRPF